MPWERGFNRVSWYGFLSQTLRQRALQRRHGFAASLIRLAAPVGAAFACALGAAVPVQADPVSIETASVVSAPVDFRLASLDPSLDQPIDEAPDYTFLIESETDIDSGGRLHPSWYNHFARDDAGQFAPSTAQKRFEAIAEKADLSPAKLAGLFGTRSARRKLTEFSLLNDSGRRAPRLRVSLPFPGRSTSMRGSLTGLR